MSTHHCHARDCETLCRPELLMCAKHWAQVPKLMQNAVHRHYRSGQCDDKRPSLAWLEAADLAIDSVALKEGKLTQREGIVWCFGPRGLTWVDTDKESRFIEETLRRLSASFVIHGDARGADSIAANVARDLMKLPVMAFPADWNGPRGKLAGFDRNETMCNIIAKHMSAGLGASALAIVRGGVVSPGTKHSIELCVTYSLPHTIIDFADLTTRSYP